MIYNTLVLENGTKKEKNRKTQSAAAYCLDIQIHAIVWKNTLVRKRQIVARMQKRQKPTFFFFFLTIIVSVSSYLRLRKLRVL